MGNTDDTTRGLRRVPVLRTLVLVVSQVSVVVALHQLGRYRWMRVGWGDVDKWLDQSPPEDVLLASARMVALVLAWWLLLSSLLYLALVLAHVPHVLRSVRWMLVPGLGRVLDGVLAISLSSSAAWSAAQPQGEIPMLVGDDGRAGPESETTPQVDPEVAYRLAIYQAPRLLAEPSSGAWTYTVEAGDSLFEIAETQLGDSARWPHILELNRTRIEAAGFPDVDVLFIGWLLELPGHAPTGLGSPSVPSPTSSEGVGPTEVTVQPGDSMWITTENRLGAQWQREASDTELGPYGAEVVDGDPGGAPAPDLSPTDTRPGADQASSEDTAPAISRPRSTEESPTSQPSPTRETLRTAGAAGSSREPGSTGSQPPEPDDDGNTRALVAGLLGGGISVAGALAGLERLRCVQQRRRRRSERIALPEPRLAEAEAHLRTGANTGGARLLEGALRAAAVGSDPAGFPTLRWIEVTPADVVLVVAQPAQPPPGFVTDGPNRWRTSLSANEMISMFGGVAHPLPLLTEIGRSDDGTEVFVDLEAHGVVTVTGDRTEVLHWLYAVALSVATAPWAVQPRVLGVDLDRLPNVEVASTLGGALDVAVVHVERLEALLRSVSMPSAAHARAAGVTPDAWEPLLVLSAVPPDEEDLAKLQSLASRPGHGFAVICPRGAAGRPKGSSNCHVGTAGSLQFDGVGMTVDAIQFSGGEVNAVSALLEHATHAKAVPADEQARFQTRLPVNPASTSKRLDDLLGEVRVLVRVLGDVQVVWREVDGTERPIRVERQKGFEALCYLAMRETTVDREDLEAALFPSGDNAQKTFQNAVTAARKAVTEQIFPAPMGGRYALSERLATDYALFADLVRWADETEGAEEGAQLLAEALTLVHGEPFTGAGRSYGWIGPHRGMVVAQIIDAADELAEIRLEGGDWRGAEWAARQGLRAFPCDERMYRILMRCAHRAGNVPGVQRIYEELCNAIADPDDGVEPYDTVHPETLALLEELTRGSRRASA